MGVKERIFLFLENQSISKAEFERRAKLSNGYLNNFKGAFGAEKLEYILTAFPNLNKVWLLTGEGEMLSFNPATSVIKDRLQRLLELEKYMKVMTPAELHQITECENLDFPKETFDKWEKLLEERDKEWEERKLEAMNKQKELCKMKIAKK